MRRVTFSRAEAEEPILLARDSLNEALFQRAAEAHGINVREHADSGEDNCITHVAESEAGSRSEFEDFLKTLINLGVTHLSVEVPENELSVWESDDDLDRHFCFDYCTY